jgi:biotin-dependent carboxylase-like uncharacterized protein
MSTITITRISPGSTIQDAGRPGCLKYGMSRSGPMDEGAFAKTGALLAGKAGAAAIEFTMAGLEFSFAGPPAEMAIAGPGFAFAINDIEQDHGEPVTLSDGDRLLIGPSAIGVYGYLRFARELDVPLVLGSRSTNLVTGLGGFSGRALKAGDKIGLAPAEPVASPPLPGVAASAWVGNDTGADDGPLRIISGLHAGLLGPALWHRFCSAQFFVSSAMDRMGIRLSDPGGALSERTALSLVSDAVVPGDIQILGDGQAVILMRDHQPTGGYPRIATVISADLDRLAQLPPGVSVRFEPVTVTHAQKISQKP